MKSQKKINPEIELLQNFWAKNAEKSEKVWQMEKLVNNFDIQKLLNLNTRLRAYYEQEGDGKALDLLDRMTVIMEELSEIINQVKKKRISLEQGQKEIQEKLREVNEVLQLMNDWEATGL